MGQFFTKESNEDRLLWACYQGHFHQVASLLHHHKGQQVNVNCYDHQDGDSPLHKACRHAMFYNGDLHVVEYLLQHGANVNAVDRGQSTPLHWACVYHDVELVRLLVQHGANVHVRDPLQQTPLHKAHDCLPIVQFLIQDCGADPQARDCFGKTLYDRLIDAIYQEFPQREYSNRSDDHTRHAQTVLEYLQSLDDKQTQQQSQKNNPGTTKAMTSSSSSSKGNGGDDDEGRASPKPSFSRQSARLHDSLMNVWQQENEDSMELYDQQQQQQQEHQQSKPDYFRQSARLQDSRLNSNTMFQEQEEEDGQEVMVQCLEPLPEGDGLLRELTSERVYL